MAIRVLWLSGVRAQTSLVRSDDHGTEFELILRFNPGGEADDLLCG
jgi:hypothetical protein